MKFIPTKLTLISSMVAFGLALHMGAAMASPIAFNPSIAVTSAACTISTALDDTTPLTATADFSAEQVSDNAAPTLSVPEGVRKVTVESNCPLTAISMVPSAAAQKFKGGNALTRNVAVASTSDGQWPVDFYWSDFAVYSTGSDTPDPSAVVRIGSGGYYVDKTYTAGAKPAAGAGSTVTQDPDIKDSAGGIINYITSAPVTDFYLPEGNCNLPLFTGHAGCNNSAAGGRSIGVLQVNSLAAGDKNRFEAYIGAAFGVTPYSIEGKPSASVVVDGETVTLTKTLTVTAS